MGQLPDTGPTLNPAMPGAQGYQGGYIDPGGANHSWASDPQALGSFQNALGTPAAPVPNNKGPYNPYASDPGYQQAVAREQLGIGSVNTSRDNLIAQRIAAYGDPNLASMAGFGLDPQGAAFARQNYLAGNAELARIDRAHQQNRQAIINRLAGHGLLDSGETGYETGLEDTGYGNNVYDAQQKALADILGYRTDALNQTNSLHDATVSALETAYQNSLDHPDLYGYGQQPASTSAAASAKSPKAAPKTAAPKTAAKAVAKALSNPYTTGRKARG